MRKGVYCKLLVYIVVIIFSALFVHNTGAQQNEMNWQPVTMLGGDQIPARWPTVTIDPYKQVHVFWTQMFKDHEINTFVIMHTFKTGNKEWSVPTDIIIRDGWGSSYPHSISANGRLYLIWSEYSGLYFSSASIIGSDSAGNWQKKRLIVQQEGVSNNSIILDKAGRFHVIFSTLGPPNVNGDGNVYYLMSPDGGNFWTSPQKISNITDPENIVGTNPRLAIDSQGELFAVWAEARIISSVWRERGIFITKSGDGGENWDFPRLISAPDPTRQLWEAAPSIGIDLNDNIHLVWTCGIVTNRCYRYSLTHGDTWSEIEYILTPYESLAGWDSMVITPDGDLHLIAQMRPPMNVYDSVKLLNGNWIGPIPISDNPEIQDAHFPQGITDGERLYIVFQQSDAAGPIWYAEGWLTEQIIFPLIPKATATSTIVPIITPQILSTESTYTLSSTPNPIQEYSQTTQSQMPMIISVLTSTLLIASIIFVKHIINTYWRN